MSRRHVSSESPIESIVTVTHLPRLVASLLGRLNETEAGVIRMRFGLADGMPRTRAEVADWYGMTPAVVQEIEEVALGRLGDPMRAYSQDEMRRLPDSLRARILGGQTDLPPLIRCGRHGWVAPEDSRAKCAQCPCPLRFVDRGRRRTYCPDACRKAASRGRSGVSLGDSGPLR